MRNTPRVVLHEELMREGMQIESISISVDQKLELLNALSRTGIQWINVGSFVSPRYTPQMTEIDALLERFEPAPDVHYTCLTMNQRGRERAARYPFLEKSTFPPLLVAHLCDTFVRRNANRSQADEIGQWGAIADAAAGRSASEAGIGVNAAWGSNFEGGFGLDERIALLSRAHNVWDQRGIPVTFVMLGDPMSWNTPVEVEDTLEAVLEKWPEIQSVYLHLHDARGMALASIYAALRVIGDRTLHIDTTVGGIGGCPYCGNGRATGMAATEDVVHMLDGMGIDTGVSIEALIEVVDLLETVLGRAVPGHLAHAGPRPQLGQLYDENLPLVETHSEATFFKEGPEVFDHPHRPWREPIPPRRDPKSRRLCLDEVGG
jgi:hydroxymethylglutaryl-CoA lyase